MTKSKLAVGFHLRDEEMEIHVNSHKSTPGMKAFVTLTLQDTEYSQELVMFFHDEELIVKLIKHLTDAVKQLKHVSTVEVE